jgi:hypothetical protein
MGTSLGVKLKKHKHNFKEGHYQKSRLALHVFEEGHKIGWTLALILQFDLLPAFKKYKEMADNFCSDNSIVQPSLKISPILFPGY